MKLLTTLLFVILIFPAWASRSVPMKGKLKSYNETHFKLIQGKKVWSFPLTAMDGPDREEIAKNIGKEITVHVPLHLVKQGK